MVIITVVAEQGMVVNVIIVELMLHLLYAELIAQVFVLEPIQVVLQELLTVVGRLMQPGYQEQLLVVDLDVRVIVIAINHVLAVIRKERQQVVDRVEDRVVMGRLVV